KDAREYFDTYTLLGNYFKNLKSKVTVLTAKDDPIISVQDFLDLKKNRFMDIRIAEHGGHNGFVKNLSFDCYYTDVLEEIIS
ncbi:MAG: hydrolase, partial [Leptospira sp.]|nr:hydrolase [Leptospira sp.]